MCSLWMCTVAAGHMFVQNLRRGHVELTVAVPVHDHVRVAFADLAPCLWPCRPSARPTNRCPSIDLRNRAAADGADLNSRLVGPARLGRGQRALHREPASAVCEI
jgi:hypothetical protein